MEQLSIEDIRNYAIHWGKKHGYEKAYAENDREIRFGSKGAIKIDLVGEYAGLIWSFEEERSPGSIIPAKRRKGYRIKFRPGDEPKDPATEGSQSQVEKQGEDKEPSQEEKARAEADRKRQHIREQWGKGVPLAGTPGEAYLKGRQLDGEYPADQVRWAPEYRHTPDGQPGSAILVPLLDDAGQLQGLAAIWVSEFGGKEGRNPAKPLYIAEKGLHLTGRLGDPKAQTLVIAEGLETGLSRLVVGPVDLRVCFGSIHRCDPGPATREVEVLADRDKIGEARAVAREYTVPAYVVVGDISTGKKGDLNDQLREFGLEGVERAVQQRERVTRAQGDPRTKGAKLNRDSDVDLAQVVLSTLENHHGDMVSVEGHLWYFDGTVYHPLDGNEAERCVYSLDGQWVTTPAGNPALLNLSYGRVGSILKVMHGLRGGATDFFDRSRRRPSIPCANGVLVFGENGEPMLQDHHRDLRTRHVLPGRYNPDLLKRVRDPEWLKGTLLGKLILGCFKDDRPSDREGKVLVLQEVAGAIAAAYATRLKEPKAAVGVGPRGGNGKSQWSAVFRGMAASDSIKSISPSRFSEDYHVCELVGSVANVCNELPIKAIQSDTFKQIVDGEEIRGRPIYGKPVAFRPQAQHWYTCNEVPRFVGGVDGGVYRRLLFVPFERTIPMEERIPHLGDRITVEEPDLLLAFAILGLERLIKQQAFSLPEVCKHARDEAVEEADLVRAFAKTCLVRGKAKDEPDSAARVYNAFLEWYRKQGGKQEYRPSLIQFARRVGLAIPDLEVRHMKRGNVWENYHYERPDD
jgi:hypothetical protein